MRRLKVELTITLETDDMDDPDNKTVMDNLLLFSQAAIRNSTVDGQLDFGIILKEVI